MKQILKLGITMLLIAFMQSCYYDNEEDLYPHITLCDTSNVTYSATVDIILDDHCNPCHSIEFPQEGIVTDNYDDLKILVDNGRFWGAVNHENGYSPMPKNLPQMNACELSKIRIWIDNGALNN